MTEYEMTVAKINVDGTSVDKLIVDAKTEDARNTKGITVLWTSCLTGL